MFRTMLKSKIHRATVTGANVDYQGSITVDAELLAAADILEHEQVQVLNVSNGVRLETYAIPGVAGSREIMVNGAAARLMRKGDVIIIVSYAMIEDQRVSEHRAKVVFVDADNTLKTVTDYAKAYDSC